MDDLGGKIFINLSNALTKLQIETLSKFGANINRVIPEVPENIEKNNNK